MAYNSIEQSIAQENVFLDDKYQMCYWVVEPVALLSTIWGRIRRTPPLNSSSVPTIISVPEPFAVGLVASPSTLSPSRVANRSGGSSTDIGWPMEF
jgi:hypothetical protein